MSEEPIIIEHETTEENSVPGQSIIVTGELLPETLLLVPLRERPVFPKMMVPVFVDNEALKQTIVEAVQSSSLPHLGLILVKTEQEKALDFYPETGEDFYKVGVTATILRVGSPTADAPLQMLVQVLERFTVEEVLTSGPVFRARVDHWYEGDFETNQELKAYSVAIIDAIKELVKLNPLFKEGLSLLLERINLNDPAALADLSASMTTASPEELQKILETKSVRSRIEQSLILIKREIEISQLKVQISQRIEEGLSKQQREFFLRQQLKEIKQELGLSKEGAETELDKFEKRLQELTVSEEGKQRIGEEMDKLRLLDPASPEFNVTRAYLDWLTGLPWGVYTEDNYDLGEAARILDEDHYGLVDVKDRILELMSVGILKGDLAGSIILLVGPPGVGKTSIGRSIARSLGRKFYRFSVGGMRDEAEIKGHRRTYIGALPGKFIQAIKMCDTANPVIMIDEIDKIGMSFQGDPASALLEVLDPEQNREFLDHYLDVRFDLSKVLFVCTANQLETIPRPLLDRMEQIRLAGYILEEKLEIARHYLLPKQLEAHGLRDEQVGLPDAVLREMIDGYAREAGVRSLENVIKKVLRKVTRRVVAEDVAQVVVGVDDLPDFLGQRLFREENVYEQPPVGVVMGLAYTALGGATLYIEATPVPASGPGFKQTGQLGKVMVESSEIAYTYVRFLLREDETAQMFFREHFVHLHVPAGATPKDGPSAGVTMACALYSVVMDRPIVPNIAMTGELTLSGLVMPIGGVKEKTIAARRAKVTHIIFPADNRADFEALDDHIKEGLTPYFVRTLEALLPICFPT